MILSPYTNCLLCGCETYVYDSKPQYLDYPIAKDRDLIKDVRIVRCKRCGFYRCLPMPIFNCDDYKILYNNNYYISSSKQWETIRTRVIPNNILKTIQKHLPNNEIHMLDIGAGEGFLCVAAKQIGWHVEAIESNEELKTNLEKRGIITYLGNLDDIRFNNKYDVITMCEVLEHIYEYDKWINIMHRILKPRGILYVGLPNEDSLYNSYLKYAAIIKNIPWSRMAVFNVPYHLVGFNKHNLEYLLKKNGFTKIYIRVHAGPEKLMKSINNNKNYRNYVMRFIHYCILIIGQCIGSGIHMVGIFRKE